MKRSLWILPLTVVGLFIAQVSPAATLTVDLNGGADYTDIQSAIDAAADGDTVIVKPGEYVITEPINFNRSHDPENPASPPVKNLTVRSEDGAEVTTIRMAETPANPERASVVAFWSGETEASSVCGFTVSGGVGTRDDPLSLIVRGGGVYCANGSGPTFLDCTISGNAANKGGGVYSKDSSPTITSCTISANAPVWSCGDFCTPSGGGVNCSGGSPTMTNCTISGNSSGIGGGVSCGGTATLTSCTIVGNAGGGVQCFDEAELLDCVISQNSGGKYNCGVRLHGNSKITRCSIVANSGGAFCQDTSPVLTQCTIARNSGNGVLCWDHSAPVLTACIITGNAGSGVYCDWNSSPSLSDCDIRGNQDNGVYCEGDRSAVLANCTILENGYGLQCRSGSTVLLRNCVISGNSFGGVSCAACSPTLTYCTISGNSGGGVYCSEDSSSALINCIVWGNIPESVCGNLSHCLTDQDPLFVQMGEWIDCPTGDDPLCIAYQWSPETGQPTSWHRWAFDYHLQPGSPAIDAGTSDGAPTTDIEGHGRPCGAGVDIGAYEYGDCPASTERFRRGDANADGNVNITDGIFTLNYLFLGGASSQCPDAADLDDGGAINITDAIYLLNFLFLGGAAPAAPFEACGMDPTLDDLDCAGFAPCGAGA